MEIFLFWISFAIIVGVAANTRGRSQALAEAGCSVDEIMAITGHRSAKMALHYTKRAARKQLAKNAMLRWEAADTARKAK